MSIQDGTYRARPRAASVYENAKGNLILAIEHEVEGGVNLKSYHTLATADGTLNTRSIDGLKSWSNWDGIDPFWFMETDLGQFEVSVVIVNEASLSNPEAFYPNIKWVNPVGAGGGGQLPTAADKHAVMAKYAAKFRAVAGAQPIRAQPPQAAPQAAPPVRNTSPAPVRKNAPQATQATAWALLVNSLPDATQDDRERIWFDLIDQTGMDSVSMTADGWAQVEAKIKEMAENNEMPF